MSAAVFPIMSAGSRGSPTSQGRADGNVALTSEQRTRIQQTVLAGNNVPASTLSTLRSTWGGGADPVRVVGPADADRAAVACQSECRRPRARHSRPTLDRPEQQLDAAAAAGQPECGRRAGRQPERNAIRNHRAGPAERSSRPPSRTAIRAASAATRTRHKATTATSNNRLHGNEKSPASAGLTLDASGPTTANQGAGGHSEKNALPDFSTAAAVEFLEIRKK